MIKHRTKVFSGLNTKGNQMKGKGGERGRRERGVHNVRQASLFGYRWHDSTCAPVTVTYCSVPLSPAHWRPGTQSYASAVHHCRSHYRILHNCIIGNRNPSTSSRYSLTGHSPDICEIDERQVYERLKWCFACFVHMTDVVMVAALILLSTLCCCCFAYKRSHLVILC